MVLIRLTTPGARLALLISYSMIIIIGISTNLAILAPFLNNKVMLVPVFLMENTLIVLNLRQLAILSSCLSTLAGDENSAKHFCDQLGDQRPPSLQLHNPFHLGWLTHCLLGVGTWNGETFFISLSKSFDLWLLSNYVLFENFKNRCLIFLH